MSAPVTLGRFELLKPLGRGAAGEVWLARDPLLERTIALKVIRLDLPTLVEPEEARQRFRREARITARLSHPHVVVVHEFGETESALFLAMEWIPGGTFANRLRKAGDPFPLAERLLLLSQVADALAYAHREGVIHRDLKPANILLATPRVAKVSDFGIGKLLGIASDLTRSGEMVGSPAYMSPEQMRGETLEDGRSDLFSLGVVLYQAVTGRKPFSGDTLPALVRQVQHEHPQDPRVFTPDLPPVLAELVMRCLAKTPDERPHDGDEIADVIRGALPQVPASETPRSEDASGEGGTPRTPPVTGQLPIELQTAPTLRMRRRRRAAMLVATAAIGVVAVATWAILVRAGRDVPNEPPVVPASAAPAPAILVPEPTRTPAPEPTVAPSPVPTRVPPTPTPLPADAKLVRLEARSGVRLKIEPDQARVFVDGHYAGVADDWDGRGGGALLTFGSPGRRRLRIAYPGHAELLVDLSIQGNAPIDVVELKETLRHGNPGGPTGPGGKIDRPDYRTHDGARFSIRNPDAVVFVDGKPEGPASNYRERELRLKSPAVHDVSIRAGTKKVDVRVLAAPSVAETATVDETPR